jgi:hypothetical protein
MRLNEDYAAWNAEAEMADDERFTETFISLTLAKTEFLCIHVRWVRAGLW